MAIYCKNPKCPLTSMSGIDSPKQHGRTVRCISCGQPMSSTPGKRAKRATH